MDQFIQIFIDFIPNDKEFIKDLMPKYEKEFRILGEYIEEHNASLNCMDNEFMAELLDFLDGNGFEVIRPRIKNPYDIHPVQLIPIYPEEKITITINEQEIEEASEKIQETIKKLQSALGEYISVQETILSDTSMEIDSRPLLECKELLAPRSIRLRVCGCMEFLRLVPEGRCGSTAVPRPP